MRSRVSLAVFPFVLTGLLASCDNDITSIAEGFDDTATWRANLSGANERPNPANTPATGRAWFTDHGTTITYYMQYDGLLANATAAHIHRGTADVAGPIMVPLQVVPGQTSGVVSGTIDMTQADISAEAGTQPPSELRTLMNTGGVYVNVHSAPSPPGFPAGEIRGQITRR